MKQAFFNYLRRKAFGLLYNASQSSRARSRPAGAVANDTRKDVSEYDRLEIDKRARYLYANIGAVRGIINDLASYSTPLLPEPITNDPDWNLKAKLLFMEWSKVCDVSGKYTLEQMQFLESVALDVSGEIFILLTEARKKKDEETAFPMLQMIRSHRIGSAYESNRYLSDGVWIDDLNRPTHYRVLEGWEQPNSEFTDVLARDIIHIGEASASDEIRHVSNLVAAINNLRDLEEIVGFEKMGVKLNAAIAAVIKTDNPEPESGFLGPLKQSVQAQEGSGETEIKLEQILNPAILTRLKKGEELQSHQSNRPGATFAPFVEFILRDIAAGMGLPLEFFWDPSKLTGPSQRAVLEKANRRIRARQSALIRAQQRKWNYAIARFIKRGQLPMNDQFWKVKWQGPAAVTIDAGRDSQQNREDIKFGIRTHAQDASERGTSWTDERNQLEIEVNDLFARAKRISTANGVDIKSALDFLQQRSPNPPPVENAMAATVDIPAGA